MFISDFTGIQQNSQRKQRQSVREGGEEMFKSLCILFNRIKIRIQIPNQQQLTIVKSIFKSGVKQNIQDNQIWIFLVNTISKIYESVVKNRMKTKMRTCNKYNQQEEKKDQQYVI